MGNPFKYFNSSPEVIRLVVMMYVRYSLSLRNVEDLLAERGIDISHETVRFWWNRFGPMFAAEIRKKRVAHMRGFTQWRWHLGEVFVKINGKLCYLWRAVDHEGEVLETVVTAKRDKAAALKFLKRIMKKYVRPRSVVTDGLCSYPAAMKEIGNFDWQEIGRRLNNRAENSHQAFRRRERAMQRFRSAKTLQKFTSVHAQVHNHFNQERHLVTGEIYKQRRSAALAEWRTVIALSSLGLPSCRAKRMLGRFCLTRPAKPLLEWCEVNDASLYMSAASLAEIALGINKLPGSQSQRASAQRKWLNEIVTRFADRIHPVDVAIAVRAREVLPSPTNGQPRHRFHDALLVATAQIYGRGLVTRSDGIFGRWTQTPIEIL
jgi:putative transposase